MNQFYFVFVSNICENCLVLLIFFFGKEIVFFFFFLVEKNTMISKISFERLRKLFNFTILLEILDFLLVERNTIISKIRFIFSKII